MAPSCLDPLTLQRSKVALGSVDLETRCPVELHGPSAISGDLFLKQTGSWKSLSRFEFERCFILKTF